MRRQVLHPELLLLAILCDMLRFDWSDASGKAALELKYGKTNLTRSIAEAKSMQFIKSHSQVDPSLMPFVIVIVIV
jgi:hypothetical protein